MLLDIYIHIIHEVQMGVLERAVGGRVDGRHGVQLRNAGGERIGAVQLPGGVPQQEDPDDTPQDVAGKRRRLCRAPVVHGVEAEGAAARLLHPSAPRGGGRLSRDRAFWLWLHSVSRHVSASFS